MWASAIRGMVPRMNRTGGRLGAGKISKRGDPYVRTVFVHGARMSSLRNVRQGKRLTDIDGTTGCPGMQTSVARSESTP